MDTRNENKKKIGFYETSRGFESSKSFNKPLFNEYRRNCNYIKTANNASRIPLKHSENESFDNYKKIFTPYDIVLLNDIKNKEKLKIDSEQTKEHSKKFNRFNKSDNGLDLIEKDNQLLQKEVREYNEHEAELQKNKFLIQKQKEKLELLENETNRLTLQKVEAEDEIQWKLSKISKEREAQQISTANAELVKNLKRKEEKENSEMKQYKCAIDYRRVLEENKERDRGKRRNIVERQLQLIQEKRKLIGNRRQAKTPNVNATRRFDHNKLFIEQVELDREERMLVKEQSKLYSENDYKPKNGNSYLSNTSYMKVYMIIINRHMM